MVSPGFGAVGFGVALIAVGGVLVSKGNNLAALLCDLVGAVFLWSAFRMYND